jgi:hypothetical protein
MEWLRESFYYKHYQTAQKELLASFDDDIDIFNYGVEQGREHRNLWDIYQKKIKKQVILIFSRIGSCL